MLVKTDKQVDPAETLPCPHCDGIADWVGTAPTDKTEQVWRDMYRCRNSAYRFANEQVTMWLDPETGDFYAYQETADAS